MKTSYLGDELTEIFDSPVWLYSTVTYIYESLVNLSYAKTYELGSIHAISFAASIGVVVSFIVCSVSNLSSVFAKKEDVAGNIVANSIFLGFSFLWLLMSIGAISDLTTLTSIYSPSMLENCSLTPTGPIVALVLGVVLLGISITGSVLLRKKKI